MKSVKICCVCGSGTVSSAMVANKLKDVLAEHGYDAQCVECSPISAESTVAGGGFSVMACVSPVYEDFGIPKVNCVGMLTGMGEEKAIQEILYILDKQN